MKSEEFVQALNDVDDKYIEEAAKGRKSVASLKIWRVVALAACALLAVSLVFTAVSLQSDSPNRSYLQESAETAAYYAGDVPAPEPYPAEADETAMEEEAAYEEAAYERAYYDEAGLMASAAAYDGAAGDESSYDYDSLYKEAMAYDVAVNSSAASEPMEPEQEKEAKIIYTVDLGMQTKEFDDAVAEIEQTAASFGGYIENQYVYNNSRSYRNASYTLRIPAENLDAFLEQMGEVSTVTYLSKNAQDVSESYYDTESRLTTARTKLERLQELLAQAEDMEDLITIETAISDVEWEIDNYSGTLRSYDSKVNYSTVTISLNEVYEVVVEEAPMTFGDRVGQSFSQGIKSVGNFLRDVVLWIAASWIWLVIIAVVIIVIVVLLKHRAAKKKARNNTEL